MQNAFMVSAVREHEFFRSAANGINEIVAYINDPDTCKQWDGCKHLALFHNPYLYRFAHLLMTLYITGPNVLDKVWSNSVDNLAK